jgi:hypothetical protein
MSPSWFEAVLIAAPGTANGRLLENARSGGHKLDDRFVVSWPPELTVGESAYVVVRIAANDYEDLLTGIEPTRPTRAERFKAEPTLEVTLKCDSGLELIEQHSAQQTVLRGQRHREWRWSVWPKAIGPHELTLLVRGIVNGKAVEDYDPEIKPYEHTGFNFSYWFLNGLFLNGISWAWAIVLLVLTNAGTIFVTSKVNKRRHSKRK